MIETNSWLESKASNPFMKRLRAGQPVTVFGVRGYRTSEIARIAKAAGNDAIWVDLEHSSISIDQAAQICATASDIGLMPFVRVPERDFGVIGRLLDGGALGIIAPRVETASQVADIGAALRFPPRGQRSSIATLPYLDYQRIPPAQVNATLNAAVVFKPLIETWRGIENIHEIAALDCVDIVGIGTNDLTAELGVPGDSRHPKVREAFDIALQACRSTGKPLAIGGLGDAKQLAELIQRGAAPFMMTGIDTDVCLAGAQERVRQALSMIQT